MRHLALTAFVLIAGAAQAQSIQPFSTDRHGATSSVVFKSCENCPPLAAQEDTGYKVPVLRGSMQSVSIMNIDGQKKIVRTEQWLGGSPVVYISKVPDWMTVDQMQAVVDTSKGKHVQTEVQVATASQNHDPIDFDAQTGAVENSSGDASDFGKVPLRLKQ